MLAVQQDRKLLPDRFALRLYRLFKDAVLDVMG
jgi:hypothetical protein